MKPVRVLTISLSYKTLTYIRTLLLQVLPLEEGEGWLNCELEWLNFTNSVDTILQVIHLNSYQSYLVNKLFKDK